MKLDCGRLLLGHGLQGSSSQSSNTVQQMACKSPYWQLHPSPKVAALPGSECFRIVERCNVIDVMTLACKREKEIHYVDPASLAYEDGIVFMSEPSAARQ